MTYDLQALASRFQRLPRDWQDPRLEYELRLCALSGQVSLIRHVQNELERIEGALAVHPFPPTLAPSSLARGNVHVLKTFDGFPLNLCFQGVDASITHGVVAGQSRTGKSCLQAVACANAASECHTLVIDSEACFRNMATMQNHDFVRMSEIRVNPYGLDLPSELVDQVVNRTIAEVYPLQYGELLLNEECLEIRKQGTPSIPLLLERLKNKKFRGFSKRGQYADSVILVLQYLLGGLPTFNCEKGMDLRELLSGNLVIEATGTLPNHKIFFVLVLMELLHLMALTGQGLDKRLVLALDEGQQLVSKLSNKMGAFRHANIVVLIGMQNLSEAPVEVLGNADFITCFQSVDSRDRSTFSRVAGLTREMGEALARLPLGSCITFVPRVIEHPMLCEVPHLEFDSKGDSWLEEHSRRFASRFSWKPFKDEQEEISSEGLDEASERFLRDVVNQSHEASSLTSRFERAGIRSASKQGQIIRRLCADGLIKVWSMAIGRGRPIKLVEPTEKALERFDVRWRKTRGSLPTRVATRLLEKKFSKLSGWTCVPEGELCYGEKAG